MPLGHTTSGTTMLRQTTLRLSPDPNKRKRRHSTAPALHDQDVIELSSDDDPFSPIKKPVSEHTASLPVTQATGHVVLEISDSDDAPSRPNTSKSDVAQRNKRLQEENDRLKKQLYTKRKDLDATQRELHKARREISDNRIKLSKTLNMKLDSLQEELQCEICTMTMWSPYLLSECGHVFCQGCLTDWFSTTQAQHTISHPTYVPLPQHFSHAIRNPDGDALVYLHARMFLAQNPLPRYTCPSCRRPVTRKPVEDYALKKVIAWVTNAQNQPSPNPVLGTVASGLWDGFFPV